MRHLHLFVALVLALFVGLAGCGGGGGGGGGTSTTNTTTTSTNGTDFVLFGRVLDVVTTGPIDPPATVSVPGGDSVQTSATDGFFQLDQPTGTSRVDVATANYGAWAFTFFAQNTDLDVGDLWVGPQRVTVTGTVRDANTNAPLANAQIRFAGRLAVTGADGRFSLAEVAYSEANPAGFQGIEGAAQADGYFASSFNAAGRTASSGVVALGDILLVNAGGVQPPGTPYNLYGRVLQNGSPVSATVTVERDGTAVRRLTTGGDGRFYFLLPAGQYTLRAQGEGTGMGTASVQIQQANQIVQRDVTLP